MNVFYFQGGKSPNEIKAAEPLIIRTVDEKTSLESKVRNVVLTINTGIITCYNGLGEFQWQVNNGPTWSSTFQHAIAMMYDADANRVKEVGRHDSLGANILIVGENYISLYSVEGELLSKIPIPQKLVKKPVLGDFDSDGVTDIVIMTEDAIFGYRLEVIESTNGMLIAVIILSVMAVLAFVANVRTDITISTASSMSTPDKGSIERRRILAIVRSTDNLHFD